MRIIKKFARIFLKVTGVIPFMIYFRLKFYHQFKANKSRPLRGGAIVIANHTSILDYFTIMFTFPFRKIRTLVSEALYAHKVPGTMSKFMDDIVIHRERSDLSFMAEAEKALRKKQVISIFPEGHLVRTGKIDTFRPAVVYLALRTGAPIVPVYIDAHYNSWKRTRVITGPKIYLNEYCDSTNPDPQTVKDLCEMLRKKVEELKSQLYSYRKMKTYNLINFKSWFLDLGKATLFLPNFIVFPTKFHYIGNASKKDRKIKDRGMIVSKHYSFLDPPILDVHYMSRRVHIVIAQELYTSNPWLFKHLLCIEYRRVASSSDPKCFMQIINFLRANGVVCIYPEGHITRDGVGDIHNGAAYFAMITNSPIYIYWMSDPYKFFRRNHVMIGETIYPDKILTKEEMKDKANIAKIQEVLNKRIMELEIEAQKYSRKNKKAKKSQL